MNGKWESAAPTLVFKALAAEGASMPKTESAETPADFVGKSFQNASFSSTTSKAIWVSIGDLSASPSLSSSPVFGPAEIGGHESFFRMKSFNLS